MRGVFPGLQVDYTVIFQLKKESEEMQDVIIKGLEKYKEEKEKGKKADRLEKHMFYTPKI